LELDLHFRVHLAQIKLAMFMLNNPANIWP
jgi:hypothetical protein